MFDRPSLKSRSLAVAAAVLGLVVVAGSGRAEAQISGTGGTTGIGTGGSGGTAFAAADFFLAIQQQTDPPVSLTTFELSRFFNKANCECATPVNVFLALLSSGIAKRAKAGITTGSVSIVLGTGCNSITGLQTGHAAGACLQIATEPVLTFLNQASYTVPHGRADTQHLLQLDRRGLRRRHEQRNRCDVHRAHRPVVHAPRSTSTSISAAARST